MTFTPSSRWVCHLPAPLANRVVAVRLGHAVERGSCTHGIGAHVAEDDPVSDVQLWQQTSLHDAVQAVTRRAPDTARVVGRSRVRHLGSTLSMEALAF